MKQDSSFSSPDPGRGRKNTFKKSNSSSPYAKGGGTFKKKNYDGRTSSGGSDGGKKDPSSRPYSGRIADSQPKRPFFKEKREEEQGEEKKFRKEPGWEFEGKPKRPFARPGGENFSGPPKKDQSGDSKRPANRKPRPGNDNPKRTFDESTSGHEKPKRTFNESSGNEKPKRAFNESNSGNDRTRPKRAFNRPSQTPEVENDQGAPGIPRKPKDTRPFRDRPKKTFDKPRLKDKRERTDNETDENKVKFGDVLDKAFHPPKKKISEDHPGKRQVFEDKVFGELEEPSQDGRPKKPYENTRKKPARIDPQETPKGRKKKYKEANEDDDFEDKEISQKDGPRLEMPLNKFIAHSGECSRRDAADLVRQGKVKVNGELIIDPGHRVKHDDKVTLSGKKLTPQKGFVYILLNKPKGFITTNDDPQGRRTVMELVANSDIDRLYPVGRLDRDTSGLLLITNDGDLTQKLCHPTFEIKKVYHVTLDKALTKADFEKIVAGIDLEDGIVKVDEIAFLEKKNEVGLEIHSGRNRIVRRIFESLGYEVTKLDRVMYAGLTKKNLPRSKWRYLDEREVVLLKHFKS